MRVALAFVAGLLWVGAAYAQTTPNANTMTPPPASASEPQATSPATDTSATQTTQTTDEDHQIVCHTVMNAGSRLSRHSNRICKTRQQWEIEADQNQRDLRQNGQNRTPMPGTN